MLLEERNDTHTHRVALGEEEWHTHTHTHRNAHVGEEWHTHTHTQECSWRRGMTHTHTGMVLEESTHTHSLTYECSWKGQKIARQYTREEWHTHTCKNAL